MVIAEKLTDFGYGSGTYPSVLTIGSIRSIGKRLDEGFNYILDKVMESLYESYMTFPSELETPQSDSLYNLNQVFVID